MRLPFGMNTKKIPEIHALKIQVIAAFQAKLNASMDAVLRTEQVLKEGADSEQEESSDRLTDKREEMMDDIVLHDEIAGHAKDHLLALAALNLESVSEQVEVGALVLTNAHNFLVCTAIPAVEIDGNAYVGISEISPVAQALLGKKVGQSAEINGTTLTIEGLA